MAESETKRKPERTCIACRRKGAPDSFFRIARRNDEELGLFDRKQSQGRTAYVCPVEQCIEKALAKDRLARALKKPVGEAARARLKDLLICKLR